MKMNLKKLIDEGFIRIVGNETNEILERRDKYNRTIIIYNIEHDMVVDRVSGDYEEK